MNNQTNPSKINPIRKRKVKAFLLQGMDAKNAMIKAGYSPRTSHTATSRKVVKECQQEILTEFDIKKITPEYVISKVEAILADPTTKNADKLKASELLGRFLAIWRDRSEVKHVEDVAPTVSDEQLDKDLEQIALRRGKSVLDKTSNSVVSV